MDNNIVNLNLMISENSEVGNLFFNLYYSSKGKDIRDLLKDDKTKVSGYPNNGGYHTLLISGIKLKDLLTWFELIQEEFKVTNKTISFFEYINKKFKTVDDISIIHNEENEMVDFKNILDSEYFSPGCSSSRRLSSSDLSKKHLGY